MKKLTRKEFLRISALASTAALIPGSLTSRVRLGALTADYDAVIIGAGLAGLTAARDLNNAGVTNILVLEAKDRVGGRTLNQDTGACYVAEAGGQWIGPTQTAIQDLMSDMGIGQFPTYLEGNSVGLDPLNSAQQEVFDAAVSELESMAETIPLSEPWNADEADLWDGMTLENWMDGYFQLSEIPAYFQLYFAVIAFLGDPSELSLLYLLFYIKSAGNFYNLDFGAQQIRISGGSHSISTAIQNQLGVIVQLNSPVDEIQDDGNEVVVISGENTYTAAKVVVAMSPKDVGNISFNPPLPQDRVALNDGWNMSAGWKMSLVYETPFWRDAGFSGQISSADIFFSFDNSDEAGDCGILVMFPGDSVTAMANVNEREQALKDAVEDAFGPEAQDNIGFTEKSWYDESFIAGCTSPIAPGIMSNYGHTLRAPIGNLHFAGTETAEIWTGYMDGAVRSGHRVADELLGNSIRPNELKINVSLFPNPATDQLNVVVPGAIEYSSLELFDSSGSKVFSQNTNGQRRSTIDVSLLETGVYTVLLVDDGKKLASRKVVVR